MRILMVCLGNICRSPLAEGILQHKAKEAGLDHWVVDSAGTEYLHVGEAPHPLSQKVATLNGIDICEQRARRFTKEDFRRFDKIYAMSEDVVHEMKRLTKEAFDPQKIDLLLNELYPGKNMSVPDPWYGTEPDFHHAYAMINEACDRIIEKYGQPTNGQLQR
jgi:protein-tyrosine phosphatase